MFGERSVEISWLFKNLKEGSVLDIGSDESAYIKQLVDEGRSVTQLDTRALNNDINTRKVVCDIRQTTPQDLGKFDNVLLISTLEHIGLTAYGNKVDWKSSPIREQLRTFRYCMEFLDENGRMLLTLPYGKYMHCGWLIVYDKDMIGGINEGYEVVNETYFTLDEEKYVECRQEECPSRGMDIVQGKGMRAISVACLVLMKQKR